MRVFEVVGRKTCIALTVLVSAGLYTSLMWLLFGNFGWQVALALALALPLMIFPAALIWYINIGGIYQAIRHKC
ncbi:MAG: hypothetical protein COS88_04675 [Chloroflexi bacterium CG07_land_8_20_14_0_80_51_10]|nr:MAG: hypothetical protein COS88_04675 [Chloroflexi bacterium CG07_land_8_20_14_0_80_51_10]